MDASCSFLKKNGVDKFRFGVILGTGFGTFINSMEDAIVIPYDSIPHFPRGNSRGACGESGNRFITRYTHPGHAGQVSQI